MVLVLKDKGQSYLFPTIGFEKGLVQSGKASWRRRALGGTKQAEKMIYRKEQSLSQLLDLPWVQDAYCRVERESNVRELG